MPQTYKNEVHLHGALVKDPDIRYTTSGKCVANLTIVTKYEQHSEFHKVVAWEKLAEKAAELKKGAFVKVVGRLATRSWEDKETGRKRYITEVVVFQIAGEESEQPPITPDPDRKSGTDIARAILSPAKGESDDSVPF